MRMLPLLLLAFAQQLLLGLASAGHHFPGATACCNWRARPLECGVGVCSQSDGCSWLCHEQCKCPEPGWMPTSWAAEIASGDLLPAAPDNPGGTIANGYLGAWVPRGLPGSAGAAVCGVEHVKGVFSPQTTPRRLSPDSGAKNESYNVILTPLASWTATSFLASIGSAKLPATASAMDFRNGAYRVASQAGDSDVNCVQTIYAHRAQPHLLISEFRCENSGEGETTVTIDEGRCNPLKPVDLYIYETLCPQPVRNTLPSFPPLRSPSYHINSIVRQRHRSFTGLNCLCYGQNATLHGYSRESKASQLAGVSCSLSTVSTRETPEMALPTVGECHTEVPEGGIKLSLPAKGELTFALISARYSNMDEGRFGTSADPVAQAKAAWLAANITGADALLHSHAASMEELHAPVRILAPFFTFVLVCPEPVLAIWLSIRNSHPKKAIFRRGSRSRAISSSHVW